METMKLYIVKTYSILQGVTDDRDTRIIDYLDRDNEVLQPCLNQHVTLFPSYKDAQAYLGMASRLVWDSLKQTERVINSIIIEVQSVDVTEDLEA